MREIKFRAWVSTQKKMLYDEDLWLPNFYIAKSIFPNSKTCYPVKVTNHGILYTHQLKDERYVEVMDKDGKRYIYYTDWKISDLLSDKTITIMQYTGLKDKNGKEIYEGDLLKYPDGEIINVIWMDSPASFSPQEIDYLNAPEIIGNIYENAELLKA